MIAGKLDRRIVVQRQGPAADNGYTTAPGAWATHCTRWASWRPANGRKAFENQGNEAKAGGTFWLRYDSHTSTILTTDAVQFDGRRWQIVGIQQLGRREGIELIVIAGD
ncbi:head-tail adaptor protein [Novosphingobium sp. fls2-241-R2A-195]|uniref:head-tail adaptor protein n=1 Tax=Novosphingobium sp. fls2-241-R2A-195 TaxID=3040296 RepID=UPI002550D45D|nr:head-tail adaptor protein [Novosphingobium sp. fls2-241-R2A-195]